MPVREIHENQKIWSNYEKNVCVCMYMCMYVYVYVYIFVYVNMGF